MSSPILVCPHCNQFIIIEQVNCGIFRHGIYKNGEPLPPHESKETCDNVLKNQLIYGCGKPFRVILHDNKFEIQICDYI